MFPSCTVSMLLLVMCFCSIVDSSQLQTQDDWNRAQYQNIPDLSLPTGQVFVPCYMSDLTDQTSKLGVSFSSHCCQHGSVLPYLSINNIDLDLNVDTVDLILINVTITYHYYDASNQTSVWNIMVESSNDKYHFLPGPRFRSTECHRYKDSDSTDCIEFLQYLLWNIITSIDLEPDMQIPFKHRYLPISVVLSCQKN